MQLERLMEDERLAGGPPDDDRARPRPTRRTVTVSLSLGAGGTRAVTLPVEEVDGRSTEEVIGAAADALREGSEPDRMFGDNVMEMLSRRDTAVHEIVSPTEDRPLRRSDRISVDLNQPMHFGLFQDHVGGLVLRSEGAWPLRRVAGEWA